MHAHGTARSGFLTTSSNTLGSTSPTIRATFRPLAIRPQDRVHVDIRHAAPKLQVCVRDRQERPRGLFRPHGLSSRPCRLLQVPDGRHNHCRPQTSIATPLRQRSSVTSLTHCAHATSHHHHVRQSPHRRSLAGAPSSNRFNGPVRARGTVSSGPSRISTGDGHASGCAAWALRHNGQSWTCRRAPTHRGALLERWRAQFWNEARV